MLAVEAGTSVFAAREAIEPALNYHGKYAMKAVRVHQPGAPEVLQIEELPLPAARQGWVAENSCPSLWTESLRALHETRSLADVHFPRVLGIECVGEVDDAGEPI